MIHRASVLLDVLRTLKDSPREGKIKVTEYVSDTYVIRVVIPHNRNGVKFNLANKLLGDNEHYDVFVEWDALKATEVEDFLLSQLGGRDNDDWTLITEALLNRFLSLRNDEELLMLQQAGLLTQHETKTPKPEYTHDDIVKLLTATVTHPQAFRHLHDNPYNVIDALAALPEFYGK